MKKADIGLIGLAVMGENLVLNMDDHGFRVAVYNRTTAKMKEFIDGPAQGKMIVNRLPCAGTLITFTMPPCNSVMRFTRDNPNPVPEYCRERLLSS